MTRTILAVGASAAVLTGIWFTAAMVKPPVSKAITRAATSGEMPAYVFPEITVQGNQVAMLCASHMGEGSVRALIGLVEVGDNTRSLTPLMPVSFGPHQGTCINLPFHPADAAVGPTTAIPVLLCANEKNAGGVPNEVFVSSVQVRDEAGTKFVVTPNFVDRVTVPAPVPAP